MTSCVSVVKKIMGEPYAGNPQVRFEEEGGNPTFTLRYVDGLNLYREYFVANGLDPSGLSYKIEYTNSSEVLFSLMNFTDFKNSNSDLAQLITVDGMNTVETKLTNQGLNVKVEFGKDVDEVKVDCECVKPGCKIKCKVNMHARIFIYDNPKANAARNLLVNNGINPPTLEQVFQHEKAHFLSIHFEINDMISSVKYDISDFNELPKNERCVGNVCDDKAFDFYLDMKDKIKEFRSLEKQHSNTQSPHNSHKID